MEAFYALATEDYRQLALAADWPALLGDAGPRGLVAARRRLRQRQVPDGAAQAHGNHIASPASPTTCSTRRPSRWPKARAALAPPFVPRHDLVMTLQDLPPSCGPYDVVWATHALYALPPDELDVAVARFVAALAPGGLGLVAQATSRSHYLAFYDAFAPGCARRRPTRRPSRCATPCAPPAPTCASSAITYRTGTSDRAVAEGFLQRCAFDDTVSLEEMEAAPVLGDYLASCRGPDGSYIFAPRGGAAMAVNPGWLPAANRDSGIDQDWAGDDQDWWDWYVTLAENDDTPAELVGRSRPPRRRRRPPTSSCGASSPSPTPRPTSASRPSAAMPSSSLPQVLSPAVVRRLAERLEELLRAEHGDDVAGRFTALEQMWLHDDLMRAGRALAPDRRVSPPTCSASPPCGIYHDNALSKEPGCGRTPWHHDAEHFPLAHRSGGHGVDPDVSDPRSAWARSALRPRCRCVRDEVADLDFDKVGTSYDAGGRPALRRARVAVEAGPFAVGEVSFHSALCFHTAGPNRTTQPRRALATTYFADGARVVESPTLISGTWRDFLPGVEPGGLAVSTLNPIVARRDGCSATRSLLAATRPPCLSR